MNLNYSIIQCIWTLPFSLRIKHLTQQFKSKVLSSSETLGTVLYTHWHWKKFKYILVSGPGWLSRYRDLLWARRSGDWIPVGARFSARVHNGPESLPASYTMNTGTSLAVKRPGPDVVYPSLSTAEVKERVELYIYTTSETSWPVLGCNLPLPF